MSTIIEQQPYQFGKDRVAIPVGQNVVFTVSNNTIVANKFNTKFIARLRVLEFAINPSSTSQIVAITKVNPNGQGVAIFDFSTILENYVSPDYNGTTYGEASTYKGVDYSENTPHPVHLIDILSTNNNSVKHFQVTFSLEYSETATGAVTEDTTTKENSVEFTIFNGMLQPDNVLTLNNYNYGFNMDTANLYMNDTDSKFLSNAPTTQYARLTDYGTMPFLNFFPEVGSGSATVNKVNRITIKLYNSAGAQLGSDINVNQNWTNGGQTTNSSRSNRNLMYFGAFPANFDGGYIVKPSTYADWNTHKANVSYYTLQAKDDSGALISQLYTFNIVSNACLGYEAVRLCWLNQWGTWDYYTFRMKSVRTISTNRVSYNQLHGNWNNNVFTTNGYQGGKKNFITNNTERIRISTDFINEEEAIWFEELNNSLEVYIVKEFQTDTSETVTNRYIEPVTITDASYTRKTIENDKKISYMFNIEKSKMKRTHKA